MRFEDSKKLNQKLNSKIEFFDLNDRLGVEQNCQKLKKEWIMFAKLPELHPNIFEYFKKTKNERKIKSISISSFKLS